MRTFIVSLLILIALTVMIFTVSAIANNSLGTLVRQIEKIEPDDAALTETVSSIRRAWTRAEGFYNISMDRRDISAIDDHFAELQGAAEAGDRNTLLITKQRLLAAIARIREEVHPNLSHLF